MGGAAAAVRRHAQPLLELAFNPEEIKARLNAVPVYTVVNNKNEFVLVAGEVGPGWEQRVVEVSAALLPALKAPSATGPEGLHTHVGICGLHVCLFCE